MNGRGRTMTFDRPTAFVLDPLFFGHQTPSNTMQNMYFGLFIWRQIFVKREFTFSFFYGNNEIFPLSNWIVRSKKYLIRGNSPFPSYDMSWCQIIKTLCFQTKRVQHFTQSDILLALTEAAHITLLHYWSATGFVYLSTCTFDALSSQSHKTNTKVSLFTATKGDSHNWTQLMQFLFLFDFCFAKYHFTSHFF